MATVSLCMIVRNEEEVLARCLRSVKGFPDEIIIVDTGSTDKTIEIAKSFGAKVYHFEWIDDFAAARNFSFSKATQDYSFWVDADDELLPENLTKLINLKPQLNRDVYAMWYDYGLDDDGRMVRQVRERIIKNRKGFKWIYPVHEIVEMPSDRQMVDITITHKRTANGAAADSDRNIRILEKAIVSEEYKNDPRIVFYLAKEYFYVAQYNQAADLFERFLKMKDGWCEDRAMARVHLVEVYLKLSQVENDKATKLFLQEKTREAAGLAMVCDYRLAEPYYFLGMLNWDLQRYPEAAHWFDVCRKLERPDFLNVVKEKYYTWLPALQAAVMHFHMNNYERAWECNEEALKYRPEDERAQSNRELLKGLLGRDTQEAQVSQSQDRVKIGFTGKGISLDAPQFRIRTYNIVKQMQKYGYQADIIDFSEIESYDIIVFGQDALSPGEIQRAKDLGKKTILNLCEALFEFNCQDYVDSIESVDMVVCCSKALADLVQQHTKQANVSVVADAVECDFNKNCTYSINDNLVVGWIGMGGSSPHAEKLRPLIEKLGYRLVTIHEHDNADIKWNRDTWEEQLLKCDVAIAPVDYKLQPAKSNNRLTTYMSLGLPVIASPLPAYLEIIDSNNGFVAETNQEWELSLRLLKHKEERQRVGQAGKETAKQFSVENITRQWLSILCEKEQVAQQIESHQLIEATEIKKVDIIVTTYGGTLAGNENQKYLRECLKSIEKCTKYPHNIIVVDAKPEQLNFSQAVNRGLKQSTSDYICILNDDIIVTQNWLTLLTENLKDNVGFVNPLSNCDKGWLHQYQIMVDGVELGPGTTALTNDGQIYVKGHPERTANPQSVYDFVSSSSKVYQRDWVAFFCTLTTRDVIEKVGLFDEEFKTGSEDLDYCVRASKFGYTCYIDERVFIYHAGGVSRKAHEDENYQKHQEEDRYNNNRIKEKYDKPTILIQTGWAYELWDGNTLREKALGGSETWAVRMAEEWVKLGYRVVVFAQTGKSKQIINGVEWRDQQEWHQFINMNWVDVYVVSRYVDFLFDNVRAGKRHVIAHDIFLCPGHNEGRWKLKQIYSDIDGVCVMSEWHREFFSEWHDVPKDKIFVIGNGVDTESFHK